LSNGLNLSSDDGKSSKRNSVELIEATPKSGLANTLEDLSHISVLMLIRAVDDNDENTEGSSEILYGFGFTSSGWSSWSTTIEHTKSLRQGNVASISEWSNTKSLLSSEELIGVGEFNISDVNSHVLIILSPDTSGVLSPGEIISILDLVLDAFLSDFGEDLKLSYMNCDKCFNSGSELLVHLFKTHLGEIGKNLMKILLLLFEFSDLLFVGSLKALSNIHGPEDLDTKKSDLGWVSERVVSGGHGVAILSTLLALNSDGGLHALFKLYEPILNVSFSYNLVDQLDLLLIWSHDLDDFNHKFSVCLIKGDSVNGIEKLFEIILDSMWVRSDGKNLE